MGPEGVGNEDRVRDLIYRQLKRHPSEILGYGDDAVAFPLDGSRLLVAHTDVLAESTDVLPGMSGVEAGMKAVTMNVSDLASKGAAPLALLFSWTIPRSYSSSRIRMIARGLDRAAKSYGTYVAGGDTSEGKDLTLAGTAFGLVPKKNLLKRSGAGAGDIVAVTGKFGLTSIAFRILLKKAHADQETRRLALASTYRPRARLREGLALSRSGSVTACMDSSDGLAKSLHWLSRMNQLRIVLDHIPAHPAVKRFAARNDLDSLDLVLYEGGEDYELVLAIRSNAWEKALRAIQSVGGNLIRIGKTELGSGVRLGDTGELVRDQGWSHFSGWKKS